MIECDIRSHETGFRDCELASTPTTGPEIRISGPVQEAFTSQRLEHGQARVLVNVPEPGRLSKRQAEPRHLEVLSPDETAEVDRVSGQGRSCSRGVYVHDLWKSNHCTARDRRSARILAVVIQSRQRSTRTFPNVVRSFPRSSGQCVCTALRSTTTERANLSASRASLLRSERRMARENGPINRKYR